jgi:hypothetical protein
MRVWNVCFSSRQEQGRTSSPALIYAERHVQQSPIMKSEEARRVSLWATRTMEDRPSLSLEGLVRLEYKFSNADPVVRYPLSSSHYSMIFVLCVAL